MYLYFVLVQYRVHTIQYIWSRKEEGGGRIEGGEKMLEVHNVHIDKIHRNQVTNEKITL